MSDRNDKSKYILIKLCALVSECICERTTKFHEKILFVSGVINVQIPTTNISVSNAALLTAVTCPEVTLCRENLFDVLAISDGVGCRRSLGHTDLFFTDQGTKVNGQYYRDVLLHQQLLSAIRNLSGDFFTVQQDNERA